jgi:hypothetical protein
MLSQVNAARPRRILLLLLALFCGPFPWGTIALGQPELQAAQTWLGKLRSIEPMDVSPSKPINPIPTDDSSLAEVPSPNRLAELLELVLLPSPQGRTRFFLPDRSPRSKLRQDKLRSFLDSAGLLGELQTVIQNLCAAEPLSDSVANGALIGRLGALNAILGSNPSEARTDKDDSTLQVKRSSANFPLLGWGPGTYQSARTNHFAIASQAGEKPTTEVASACEVIFSLWQGLFADRFAFPNDQTPAFRVVLFRNRDAYVRALKSIEPKISISTGYYSPAHRMSFFYWDGPKSFPTLVHELTHQFFDATLSDDARFDPDSDPGAWAIEAVALYMESWSEEYLGGLRMIDIGGWDAPRAQAGRFRRLRDQYWIPWDEFAQADGRKLRADPDISAWYSQACGLAHFWLDSEPTSREAFLTYLQSVYHKQGRQAAKDLVDDDSLRSAYDQYLLTGSNPASDPNECFSSRPSFLRRSELVLSRCSIDSQTLLKWPTGLRNIVWMDLGFTKVNDDLFIQTGTVAWQFNRLNLESTDISDASMSAIATMKNLTELDLSNCNVTDAGLKSLANHPNLKQLWLTNTNVSDRSIEVLASIPKLERLEASGALTAVGLQELMKKKPRLKKP